MDPSTLGIPGLRFFRSGGSNFARTTVKLPAWEGYLVHRYENARKITDGTIMVDFACNALCARADWEPQLAAYHHLIEHQEEIRDAVTAAVLTRLPDLLQYLDPGELGLAHLIDDTTKNPQSAIRNPKSDALRPHIGPHTIYIREDQRDGLSYVDWYLNCTWDDEHGIAASTHGTRLIDLDSGETDIYKIFADNGTLDDVLKEAEQLRNQPKRPAPPKPWWKFW